MLDRIDLYIPIKKLKREELITDKIEESSEIIRERVCSARAIQKNRFNTEKLNSSMTQKEIKSFCSLTAEDLEYIGNAIEKLSISARSYDKILKVARTIADLENSKDISKGHILEALSFRKK